MGQLVFWLWGIWFFLLRGSRCFGFMAVDILFMELLVFWLWGSCAMRAVWWLWWHHPSFSPPIAKARQWPYSYICWDNFQIWRKNCELLRMKWWTAIMTWELNVGLEHFILSCSLIRSIQKGLGIGRNPHNRMRNVWWMFQIRAVVLKQLNLFAL